MKQKKIISMMLITALLGTTVQVGLSARAADGIAPQDTEMVLWYDEPSTSLNSGDTWQQATLPIGNGILGANVYGELGEEHLTLNEETLWSGGRGSVTDYNGGNPSESKTDVYNSLSEKYLNGASSSYSIEDLAGVSTTDSGYLNGYQPLGDLYVSFSGAPTSVPSDYVRTLNLESGLSQVAFTYNGNEYTRTYFASNPDNVIVAHYTAEGSGNLNFTASLESKQDGKASSSVENNQGMIVCEGTVYNNGLLHNTQLLIETDKGSITASSGAITVSGANSATIYLTAATDYENTFYDEGKTTEYYYRTGETAAQLDARVGDELAQAAAKGYEAVLRDHLADYQSLYSRVNLDLGQSSAKTTDQLLSAYQQGTATAAEQRFLEVLMFQYGRYLLISGSRENSQLPTTLQGIWNDKNSAPWYSDIHTNINEQMNYWLSGNCNLAECAVPLVNYMASLEEPGGRTVEIYTGSKNGIMAHTQNTPFGYTSPGWTISTWGWSPAAATWLLQNCYDYYQYSGDTVLLQNTLYPVLREQVLMYEELLREKDGRMVMPITQSPELSTITAGNTYEQSIIWQLYADTIEAAYILGADQDLVAGWTETMELLQPIEIGNSGQVKEWYEETTINSVNDTTSHRHLSNLLGLYPGDLFDTEEKISAAVVSLNNKNFGRVGTYSNPEGGWTYGQLIGSWARVGSGVNAYYSISQMLKNRLYDNLWDYHTYESNGAFQIDGNYGYSAGVAEMLMQSNQGYINTLPALPAEWSNGSVDGLLAEGGFEVDMDWTAGSLTAANITSKNGGSCSVKVMKDAQYKIVDTSGKEVAYTVEDGVYTFDTVSGSEYTFKEVNTTLDVHRNADGSVTLTWDAKDGVTYTIKRKKIN